MPSPSPPPRLPLPPRPHFLSNHSYCRRGRPPLAAPHSPGMGLGRAGRRRGEPVIPPFQTRRGDRAVVVTPPCPLPMAHQQRRRRFPPGLGAPLDPRAVEDLRVLWWAPRVRRPRPRWGTWQSPGEAVRVVMLLG